MAELRRDLEEMHVRADLQKRFYVELSKAGFGEDELRVIRDVVRGTCMRCLQADSKCDCNRVDYY